MSEEKSVMMATIQGRVANVGDVLNERRLAEEYGMDFESREFRLTLHAAKEELRRRFGLVLVPAGHGQSRVADELQKHRRANRMGRAAVRKAVRAAEVSSLVDETKVDPDHRDAVCRSKERHQLALGRLRLRSAERPDPVETARPVLPRGR